MRSQGQVRFITISSRMQIAAASLVVAVIGGWGVSMGVMAVSQYQTQSERLSLLHREAEVATAESRQAAYRDDIEEVTDDVARRMEFLEEATAMLPDDAVAGGTVSAASLVLSETVSSATTSLGSISVASSRNSMRRATSPATSSMSSR